jgi:hypothetical protein
MSSFDRLALTPDAICALARRRERHETWLHAAVALAVFGLAAALLFNVYAVEQPWIRVGQAWTIGVLSYLFLAGLERGPARRQPGEPCASFLAAEHERRGRAYRWLRQRLFLIVPGMIASWWGRPPGSRMWPFLAAGAGLSCVWLLLGKAADKADADCAEVRRVSW